MPTYEYVCTACAERLEVVQSFTDAALTECPVCAGRLRKVFSPVGVVFKGSGFYKTDSRSKPASSSGSQPKKEAAPAADSGGSAPAAPATPPPSTGSGGGSAAAAS